MENTAEKTQVSQFEFLVSASFNKVLLTTGVDCVLGDVNPFHFINHDYQQYFKNKVNIRWEKPDKLNKKWSEWKDQCPKVSD